jgi:hypothetical protein
MPERYLYYALTLVTEGNSTIPAYYSVTPTSNVTFSQGGATIMPTSAAATLVNVYPETLQLQAPAGSINAGVTIATNATTIAGRVMISPPVDCAVIVTLYGVGGQQIGQLIIDPAVGGGLFDFSVDASNAIPAHDLGGVLRGLVPPATP